MSTFILKIDMGNAVMRTQRDVSEALNHVARGMREDSTWHGAIIDGNGNTVGSFELDGTIEPNHEFRNARNVEIGQTIQGPDDEWHRVEDAADMPGERTEFIMEPHSEGWLVDDAELIKVELPDD